jgi:hypothetical protein
MHESWFESMHASQHIGDRMREYPAPFESWKIGAEFWMSGSRYRVTDVGSRTIAAICIDLPIEVVVAGAAGPTRTEMRDDPSWFNGPPYAVVEHVMDEDDLQVCYLEKPED